MAHEVRHVRDVMRDVRDVNDDEEEKEVEEEEEEEGKEEKEKEEEKAEEEVAGPAPKSKDPIQRCGELGFASYAAAAVGRTRHRGTGRWMGSAASSARGSEGTSLLPHGK